MTPNINHRYIKVKEGDRIDVIILKMTTGQGMDHSVETKTLHTEEILVEILDKIIGGDHETIIEMTIEETITENRGTETGVSIETITGIPIETESILERTICKVDIIVEIEVGQDNHAPNLEKKREGTDINQH